MLNIAVHIPFWVHLNRFHIFSRVNKFIWGLFTNHIFDLQHNFAKFILKKKDLNKTFSKMFKQLKEMKRTWFQFTYCVYVF